MASELTDMDTAARRAGEPAERLRRPSWRDPRLVVGVMIVVASVAGIVGLVASQDRTAPVYAADRLLSVGEQVEVDDLRVVEVRIDEVADRYLSAHDELPADLQFVTVVDEGELIPLRALDQADPHGRQAVTLEVDDALARAVEPGRVVELWAAYGGSVAGDSESRVERLVEDAEVSAVTESTSTFGAQSEVSVELLVDPERLPDVLGARSSAATLSLVPAENSPSGSADAVEAEAEEDEEQEEQG